MAHTPVILYAGENRMYSLKDNFFICTHQDVRVIQVSLVSPLPVIGPVLPFKILLEIRLMGIDEHRPRPLAPS